MGQDPNTIRQQIEDTRSEMSETVDALGYKADVKARAKENVQGKVDAVTGAVGSVKDKIVGQASDTSDGASAKVHDMKDSLGDGADATKQKARKAASVAQQNPLGLAVGAVAIGFIGGLLIPTTQVENEKLGPIADQLKDQARDAGQEAFERGKAVASSAVDTVKESAQDAAQTVVADARDAAPTSS